MSDLINTQLRLRDPDQYSYDDKWEHWIKVRIQPGQLIFPIEPSEIYLWESNNFQER